MMKTCPATSEVILMLITRIRMESLMNFLEAHNYVFKAKYDYIE